MMQTPVTPVLLYKSGGLRGSKLYRHVFGMDFKISLTAQKAHSFFTRHVCFGTETNEMNEAYRENSKM